MKKLLIAGVGVAMTALISGCFTAGVPDTTYAKLGQYIDSQLKAKAQSGKFYSKYRIPSDDEIRKIAERPLSPDELADLKKEAERITRLSEKEIVWPIWIETIKARVLPVAEKLLAAGDYDRAREVIWRASTTGVDLVDAGVREFGYEFLNTQVNPKQWKKIEKGMRDKALEFEKRGAYDEGVAWLKTVPRIREYSTVLDDRLINVKAELVKLSVADKDVQPIVEKTKEMMRLAAKIYDEADKTTNSVSGVASNADLAVYEAKLKEYRQTLVRYNCTESNADKIVAAFKKDAQPLLDPLYISESTDKAFLYLGTAAVNKRIDAYVDRLTKWLAKKRTLRNDVAKLMAEGKFEEAKKLVEEDVCAVTIAPMVKVSKKAGSGAASKKSPAAVAFSLPAVVVADGKKPAVAGAGVKKQVADSAVAKNCQKAVSILSGFNASEAPLTPVDFVFAGEVFRSVVRSYVALGAYAGAREFIWAVCYPEEHTVLTRFLQPIGKEMMQTCVNPANWNAVETSVSNNVALFVKESAYTNAVAWLESYPLVKVYAAEVDAKLGAAAAEAVRQGVKQNVVSPAVGQNESNASESDNIADRTDETKEYTVPGKEVKLDKFEELLAEYRKVLLKNDCTTNNADKLVADFREAMAPHFKSLSEGEVKQRLYLGCNGLNERIKALVAKKIEEVKELEAKAKAEAEKLAQYNAEMQARIDDLVKRVIELVKEEKFTEARETIRDVELVKDAKWDAKMYATRIGLLNSLVNPRQCEKLMAEIERKAKAFLESEDYEGLRDYEKNYPYVHDTYQHILDALEQIKSAMLEMPIREPKTIAYVEELTKRLNEIMEKRLGALDYNHDFAALEKALQELQQAYVEQHYNEDAAKAVCERIRIEIKAMLASEFSPMTTWEMNELLRAKLAAVTKGLDELIALQKAKKAIEDAAKAYAELLAEIDAEVSFDAQIAMAEDAISKQLGIKCQCACLEMNAVLGNYARVLRLMKRGAMVSVADATTLLAGATYLGQTAMFKRALELKADVNAPAERDPRARPALLIAIESGNTEFLRLIHEAKGLQTVTDAAGNTALHYAMKNGNLAVARVLAKAVDVTAVNKKGETALFTAVRRNQAKPVEFLINLVTAEDDVKTKAARKAFVNFKNAAGEDAFTVGCRADVHMVLDALFVAGAEFNDSHLVEAAGSNRIAIAQWLVEHGADVNADGVMAAAFGTPDDEDTETYKYLVHEGGIALERTPKCCKEARDALKKCMEEKCKAQEKKCCDDVQASVVGNITFDVKKNK